MRNKLLKKSLLKYLEPYTRKYKENIINCFELNEKEVKHTILIEYDQLKHPYIISLKVAIFVIKEYGGKLIAEKPQRDNNEEKYVFYNLNLLL